MHVCVQACVSASARACERERVRGRETSCESERSSESTPAAHPPSRAISAAAPRATTNPAERQACIPAAARARTRARCQIGSHMYISCRYMISISTSLSRVGTIARVRAHTERYAAAHFVEIHHLHRNLEKVDAVIQRGALFELQRDRVNNDAGGPEFVHDAAHCRDGAEIEIDRGSVDFFVFRKVELQGEISQVAILCQHLFKIDEPLGYLQLQTESRISIGNRTNEAALAPEPAFLEKFRPSAPHDAATAMARLQEIAAPGAVLCGGVHGSGDSSSQEMPLTDEVRRRWRK
eukprot:6194545-Pleurochrysis_carterae.AAC.5